MQNYKHKSTSLSAKNIFTLNMNKYPAKGVSTTNNRNNKRTLQSAQSMKSISSIRSLGNNYNYSCNDLNIIGNNCKSNLSMISGKNINSHSTTEIKESYIQYKIRLNESLSQYEGVDSEKILQRNELELAKINWNDSEINSNANNVSAHNYNDISYVLPQNPIIPKTNIFEIQHIVNWNRRERVLRNGESQNSKIKVNVDKDSEHIRFNQLFSNPVDSLRVIRKNYQVYDDINKSYVTRQAQWLEESIEALEGKTMKFRTKMPKIRVNNVIAKGFYESPNAIGNFLSKKNTWKAVSDNKNMIKWFSFFKYPNKNFPEGREQFTLTWYNNEIILLGGNSSVIRNNNLIWRLNPESLEWTSIKSEAQSPYIRWGHSVFLIRNKFLYIFGGRSKFSNTPIVEYSTHDCFNWETSGWVSPWWADYVKPCSRRNFLCEQVGMQYIIHGGYSYAGEVWNDSYILSSSNQVNQQLKWTKVHFSEMSPVPYLYGHKCCLVIPFEIRFNNRLNVYHFPTGKLPSNIKEKGWYVFGGCGKNEKPKNEMYILQWGKQVLEWKLIETRGSPPLPRYEHSMNFYEKGNFIIIHGGRNDFRSDSFAWNDTWIFSWSEFQWFEVMLYNNDPEFKVISRCGHNSIVYDGRLIIFGGMNCNNFVGSSWFVTNLDFNYVHISSTQEEKTRKYLRDNYGRIKDNKIQLNKLEMLTKQNQWGILPENKMPEIK